jgi:hypothetical protein
MRFAKSTAAGFIESARGNVVVLGFDFDRQTLALPAILVSSADMHLNRK